MVRECISSEINHVIAPRRSGVVHTTVTCLSVLRMNQTCMHFRLCIHMPTLSLAGGVF